MQFRPALVGIGLAVTLTACHGPPQPLGSGLSLTSQVPPSSLLRLPANGGSAQIYRAPTLGPSGWSSQNDLAAARRPIGADLDQELVYLLGAHNELVVLDLQTGKVRGGALAGVREAALGPDGTLFTVGDSNVVTQFVRRSPVRFQTKLAARPSELFGTRDDRLLALTTGTENTLSILASDQPPETLTLPRGDATATFWGDLIAVAADSAVILVEPEPTAKPVSIPISGHARAVVFSPSGHRLYVARREGPIQVINRYTTEVVGQLQLPGPAGALRPDPYGRWMLVHPPDADSVWVVDLATGKFLAGFATSWGPDLPTVTNQQALIVKSGADVVSYDLTAPGHPETGRVAGGARDFWLPLAWTPETGTSAPTPETPAAAVDTEAESRAEVFLQVSSSQNRSWAAELARQLAEAGLPATVRDPHQGEEGYRVLLGPYPSREAAESTGRKLGRPFFVYQPDR